MSLRARLVVGVLALTTVGLIVAGAVTYAQQRSFQYDRIDAQTAEAVRLVTAEIAEPGSARRGAAPKRAIEGPGPDPDDARPGGRGARPRGPAPDVSSALYGQLRDSAGRTVRSVTPLLASSAQAPPAPRLADRVKTGAPFTVGSEGSSGLRYRVRATPTADGGVVVAALPLADVDAALSRLLGIEALVFGSVLLLLGVGVWWVVRVGLRPLDAIGATAGAIAAGDLSRRVEPAEPRTEVGRLGLSLNAMLARLEEAFAERRASEERLRRFLADASHELRTPLQSIRGYAELFRLGAAAAPADLEKAMTRIEGESARMGVLVDDLLALARLDEVRAPIREPVDLAALATDAAADARATAPERAITLRGVRAEELRAGDAEGCAGQQGAAIVDGDPGQLRQVLANLMRNALVHTPAGTPVELSVQVGDGEATLAVRDHGAGLPPGDPDALFERFWRADPGRGRGRAGAGLGLAIVAAIVAAHGGRARACDAAGGGARFEVVLPLAGERT